MKTPMITITTDLGDGFATSQIKAVAASLEFGGQLIENHDVEPFSIIEGAYGIWQLAKFCPPGTVHLGIVDPGVGSTRSGIAIKSRNFWFVGPDNGLLYPAAATDGIETIWRLDEKYFDNVANTFHGRDLFVKQAVYLTETMTPRGEKVENITELEFRAGQIVHIDNYGNAKIWGRETFGLPVVKTFSDVPEGSALLINGSSDLLELAINCGNAAEQFGLKLGQVIDQNLY